MSHKGKKKRFGGHHGLHKENRELSNLEEQIQALVRTVTSTGCCSRVYAVM